MRIINTDFYRDEEIKAVAYCRVSTNKEEQLDSLESQQNFFLEYAKKNHYVLLRIYADEGKSGTKMKNRTELLKLLSDAKKNEFNLVLIKDVSRLARNTVDFLTSIRRLKSLGIKVVFVNYDQTSSDSSEFMLTMLSAIAQEESANTSKRVKFGKRLNAEKGKVPNLIYGYDKINGDYFNLMINEKEADVVRRIFDMYTVKKHGTGKIAKELNNEGYKTKRNCNWSQNAVTRILSNELYIGHVINGKEEVIDFLTGSRERKEEEKWLVVEKPEFKIVEKEVFEKANSILEQRTKSFQTSGKRESDKYIFSKLIQCNTCGSTFRRLVRTGKNTTVTWVCSGRNSKGSDTCANNTVINEDFLIRGIENYFLNIFNKTSQTLRSFIHIFCKKYKNKDNNYVLAKEYENRLYKAKKAKEKYMEMFHNDIINLDELKKYTRELQDEIEYLSGEVSYQKRNIKKSDLIESALMNTLNENSHEFLKGLLTNHVLKRVIQDITVDEQKNIHIYLRVFTDKE